MRLEHGWRHYTQVRMAFRQLATDVVLSVELGLPSAALNGRELVRRRG